MRPHRLKNGDDSSSRRMILCGWSWNQLGRQYVHRGVLAQAVPDAVTVYTVEAGDNLWSIANNHGISVGELQSLNEDLFPRRPRCGVSSRKWHRHRANDAIFPGDKLYLPRHAHHWNKPSTMGLQQVEEVDGKLPYDDISQAAMVPSGVSPYVSHNELDTEPTGVRVNGYKIAEAAVFLIGIFAAGRALWLRDRDDRGKGSPTMQTTELNTSEDIIAHTAEDADGRYLKSGYALPSKLHDTAVLSAVTHQDSFSPLYSNSESAASLKDVSVRDLEGGSRSNMLTSSSALSVPQPVTVAGPTSALALDPHQSVQGTGHLNTPCPQPLKRDDASKALHFEPVVMHSGLKRQDMGSDKCTEPVQSAVKVEETGEQASAKHANSQTLKSGTAGDEGLLESHHELSRSGDTFNCRLTSASTGNIDHAVVDSHDDQQPSTGPPEPMVKDSSQASASLKSDVSAQSNVVHHTQMPNYDELQSSLLDECDEYNSEESLSGGNLSGSSQRIATSSEDAKLVTDLPSQKEGDASMDRHGTPTLDRGLAVPNLQQEQATPELRYEDAAPQFTDFPVGAQVHLAKAGSADAQVENGPSIDFSTAADVSDIRVGPCLQTFEQLDEVAHSVSTEKPGTHTSESLHGSKEELDVGTPGTATPNGMSISVSTEPASAINPVGVLAEILSALYVAATNDPDPGPNRDQGESDQDTSDQQHKGASSRAAGQWESQDPIGSLTQMATVMAAAAGILTGGVARSLLDMIALPQSDVRRRDEGTGAAEQQPSNDPSALEMRLIDLAYKTERGCKLTSSDRTEMEQIVVQLEALAESQPSQVMDSIDGPWILAMTDDQEILALMDAVNALPLVALGEITQQVNMESGTVINSVQLAAPMPFTLSATVPWNVQKARKPYYKFSGPHSNSHVSTPHLMEGLHTAILERGAELLVAEPVSQLLQQLQDSSFAKYDEKNAMVHSERHGDWLNSCAHDTLRIARGPSNTILVFTREASRRTFS